ncbi:unnamed protein product [Aphanomyces euteiches]|uniref:Wings apart-like protein C-terminal domain-containing protein n=2 Tax=Aphanomyces euteiches TaxID=100861 RepID=A0A6G0WUC9_9STRA|nr:hypothetical protein Ae201684_011646 [Aphanomyces euteiches]KAH9097064.1 hypothetical protein Ae201684P_011793 [Aphanomyces euteiches]
MQSTASLQHSGESHAALEQIHYYLDGVAEGTGTSRSISALKLAEFCASTENGGNGRLLLRAKGGLTQCIKLMEELKLDENVQSYEHVYCMMTLLYFVTLDTENCEALCADAFVKLKQVLQYAASDRYRYKHVSSAKSAPDDGTRKRRALQKKKAVAHRSNDNQKDLTRQAEDLLRSEAIFQSTDVFPIVSLCDVVLGVLNNSFHTDHTSKYGVAQNKAGGNPSTQRSDGLLQERKLLLRDTGGLDAVAQIVETSYRAVGSERGASTQLLHGLRLIDQVSFMEPCNQDHLVLETNILSVILDLVQKNAKPNAPRRSFDLYLMAMRVLINLTHKNDIACTNIAAVHGTHLIVDVFLEFQASHVDDKLTFDTCLLTLSALVNCVEHNDTNRDDVGTYQNGSLLDTLVSYFRGRVASFQHILLEPDESATWNPEDVVLSGSVAMLLGCLMRQRPVNAARILSALPDGSPRLLLRVLVAFVGLHAQIGALSEEILESCIQVETELKALQGLSPESLEVDIRASISHLPVHSKKRREPVKREPLLKVAAPLEEKTPSVAYKFQSETPPASAFKFNSASSSAKSWDSPDSKSLRKRSSRSLAVNSSPASEKRPAKASQTWSDDSPRSKKTSSFSKATYTKRAKPSSSIVKQTVVQIEATARKETTDRTVGNMRLFTTLGNDHLKSSSLQPTFSRRSRPTPVMSSIEPTTEQDNSLATNAIANKELVQSNSEIKPEPTTEASAPPDQSLEETTETPSEEKPTLPKPALRERRQVLLTPVKALPPRSMSPRLKKYTRSRSPVTPNARKSTSSKVALVKSAKINMSRATNKQSRSRANAKSKKKLDVFSFDE